MMPVDCNNLGQYVTTLPLVTDCDIIQNQMLRLATPFKYPDGSNIDLFLGEDAHLHPVRLSDLGQTTAYLLDLQLKPWATQRRKQILEDVCKALAVDRDGGELLVRLRHDQLHTHDLPEALVRLAQACIRVADMAYTQRLQAPAQFRDEVEEFISTAGVQVESNAVLPGRYGKDVRVDFQTRGKYVNSLILTLSTQNATAAHTVSNETFRRWYDLERYRMDHQFLTLYDSTSNIFRDDDLSRLSELSTVLAFPAEQDAILDAVAA